MSEPWEDYQTGEKTKPWEDYKTAKKPATLRYGPEVRQRAKELLTSYARPVLEAGGLIGGSMLAAPSGPAGMVAGAGLGYAGGVQAANLVEQMAGLKQPGDILAEISEAGKDVATGAMLEMGGQTLTPILSGAGRMIKRIPHKWMPTLRPAKVAEKAGKLIQETGGTSPIYAQNAAEAKEIEKLIDGFKASIGEATGDPALIKMQRGLEAQTGSDAANIAVERRATNVKAFKDYLDKQFAGGKNIEEVMSELVNRKAALEGATQGATLRSGAATARVAPTTPQEAGANIIDKIKAIREPILKQERTLWGEVENLPLPVDNTRRAFGEALNTPTTAEPILTKINKIFEKTPQTVQGLRRVEQEIDSAMNNMSATQIERKFLGDVKKGIQADIDALGAATDAGDIKLFDPAGKAGAALPKQIQKLKDFETAEGKFTQYAFEGDKKLGEVTVQKSPDGFTVRNILFPESARRKGIATQTYEALNEQSIKETGNPLMSTKPRTLLNGTKVHEMTADAKALWDSFVTKGKAVKKPDGSYQYKSPAPKPAPAEGKQEILYHGTNAEYVDAEITTGKKMYGIHLTTDEAVAKDYGKVKKYVLSKDAKSLDLSDGDSLWNFMKKEGILDAEDMANVDLKRYVKDGELYQYDISSRTHLADDVAKTAESLGYDVVKMPDNLGGRGDNVVYVVVNKKALQPPEVLKDYPALKPASAAPKPAREIVYPSRLQNELATIEKRIAEAQAKPPEVDIGAVETALRKKGVMGAGRQQSESQANANARMAADYKRLISEEVPTIQGTDQKLITELTDRKAKIENILASAEPAGNVAQQIKAAKDFSREQKFGRFDKGAVREILKRGSEATGRAVPDAQVAARFLKPDAADQLIKALGDKQQAAEAMDGFIAHNMESRAMNTTTREIIPKAFNNWLAKNRATLDKYGLTGKYDSISKANASLEAAKATEIEFNKSIAGKLLNASNDPVVAGITADNPAMIIGQVMAGSKNTANTMHQLMRVVKGNPDATAGLKNAFKDFIVDKTERTAKTIAGDKIMSNAGLMKALKKYEGAMRVLYADEPAKLKAIQNVQKAIEISARNVQVGVGSDTAEKLSAMSAIGEIAGHAVVRATGAPGLIVTLAKKGLGVFSRMGANDLRKVLTQAVYDPEFAQTLMMAKRGVAPKIVERRIAADLLKMGIVAASNTSRPQSYGNSRLVEPRRIKVSR